MEGKNPQKSVLEWKMFKIPIERYEKHMETEMAKGKKKEILDLFNNYNKLSSKIEFDMISSKLYLACMDGDLDLIKIYLSKRIENNSNAFQFKIDETNRTASLFYINNDNKEVIIPRTVEYESNEYLITSICGTCENIETLKFVEDSAVKIIYGYSFPLLSKIKEIYFPASLKELKKGWCDDTRNLTKIIISPFNGQFVFKEDKYLLGKSDENSDEFDIFLFANRDIKEISIPSNIKIISSFAFYFCRNLTKIEIPKNSNLQIIESKAFIDSNIKEIFIPSKVSKICEQAFSNCNYLTKIEIPKNSNLQTIESNAFSLSKIKEIYFPASLKELKKEWCYNTDNLNKILISPFNDQFIFKEDKYLLGKSDENNDDFDVLVFVIRDIKEISIPSNIKIISSCAFNSCKNIKKVEIQPNSNLQIIESCAFSESNIKEIFIPSKVSKICEYAFFYCKDLARVEIQPNSNLQIIESHAFFGSNIDNIFIPSNVTKICQSAFSDCFYLTKVEIESNSNLQIIEESAFTGAYLKNIFIPSNVSKICENAFFFCFNLQIIEISEESKMESFPLNAFKECSKLIIMIPPSLEKLVYKNK